MNMLVSQNPLFFYFAFFGYLISMLCYAFAYVLRKNRLFGVGFKLAAAGVMMHAIAIIFRWIESGFMPLSNMFESLSFFSFVTILAALILDQKTKQHVIALLTVLVGFVLIAIASVNHSDIHPLVPALQSYWLVLHVSFAFIGDAAFVVAFISGLLYVCKRFLPENMTETLPELDVLDDFIYRSIGIGYPIFALGGLVFGSIWAHYAWGSYWSWDPKETWALITFLVYSLYLHYRLRHQMGGTASALFAIGGFAMVIFTYVGVNYFLPGLHSYAG